MDERQKFRAEAAWIDRPPTSGSWTVSRVEIVSTLLPRQWPVAQVELVHEKRGRILEIGTGAGCVDAAFNAIAQVMGVTAPVIALQVQYGLFRAGTDLAEVLVEVEALIDGVPCHGCAQTGDLLLSAVAAYVDAISKAERDRPDELVGPLQPTSGLARWESWK